MAADERTWLAAYWPRPLETRAVTALLRQWAADQRSPRLVLEARAGGGAVRWLFGVPSPAVTSLRVATEAIVPGARLMPLNPVDRPPVDEAGRLRITTRHRPLRTAEVDIAAVCRAVLGSLSQAGQGEVLVLQVVLGPRRVPLAVPTNSPAATVQPWHQVALYGNGPRLDGEKRTALRAKVSDHGFACTIRLGVRAASPLRRRTLLLSLLAGLRTAEAAGVQLRVRREPATRLNAARSPRFRWPLRLGVPEVAGLLGWPIGDGELPGLGPAHPRLLPAAPVIRSRGRIVAQGTAPGDDHPFGLTARDNLQHLHVLGPTGTGKSTLLLNLITQDIAHGRAVVVIEPKGDLVADVLARIPEHRQNDVVVLDPADRNAVVGLNPLASAGDHPELAVDGIVAVFKGLFGDALGPRTTDILHAALLTLTRRPDASLVMLPLLLTNPGFRRALVGQVSLSDPIALGPFWAWYEGLSDGERAQAIAPLQNKLRQFLLRPSVRAVLGQSRPRFDLRQVFTQRKVLLCPLGKGALGPEASGLLGSLIVAQLWQTALQRARVPAERRHPVTVYIDEVQDYLHLPTDVADVLAQARGLGVGLVAAHQHLGQLSASMQAALLANARSRICFTLPSEDAAVMARRTRGELTAEDFTSLGRYEVYASLVADGRLTPYASGRTLPPGNVVSDPDELRARSRAAFGQPLGDIEAAFAALLERRGAANASLGRRPRRQP